MLALARLVFDTFDGLSSCTRFDTFFRCLSDLDHAGICQTFVCVYVAELLVSVIEFRDRAADCIARSKIVSSFWVMWLEMLWCRVSLNLRPSHFAKLRGERDAIIC